MRGACLQKLLTGSLAFRTTSKGWFVLLCDTNTSFATSTNSALNWHQLKRLTKKLEFAQDVFTSANEIQASDTTYLESLKIQMVQSFSPKRSITS